MRTNNAENYASSPRDKAITSNENNGIEKDLYELLDLTRESLKVQKFTYELQINVNRRCQL